MIFILSIIQTFFNMWLAMHKEYKKYPNANDKLFFDATIVIIVTAKSQVSGVLASSRYYL